MDGGVVYRHFCNAGQTRTSCFGVWGSGLFGIGLGNALLDDGINLFGAGVDNKYLKVTEENGCLVITDTNRNYSNANGKIQVNLYLPTDFTFQKANITTGAGQVNVDRLAAEDLYLELGAGQVQIETLEATRSSKINGGAGQVIVNDGTLHNLDLDMGVGELRIKSALTGDCDLDMGVGATYLNLVGSIDDYRIELDKGVGAATLEGESLSDGAVRGSGENTIDIDGGVGEIRISFAGKDAA